MVLPLRTPALLAISPHFSCCLFVYLSPGCQDVRCQITLLYKIMDLCINTAFFGSSRCLIDFCHRYDLVERIQVREHPVLGGRGPLAPYESSSWAELGSGGTACWQLPSGSSVVLCR